MKKIIAIITCVVLFCFLIGCDANGSKNSTCIVSFNTDGGTQVESQTVIKGEKAIIPANPTKEEYAFDGWYYKGKQWSFIDDSVNEDITLDAKWTLLVSVNFYNYYGRLLKTFVVRQGDSVSYDGEIPTRPEDEIYTNHFLGWDKDLSNVVSNLDVRPIFEKNVYIFNLSEDGSFYILAGVRNTNINNAVIPTTYKNTPVTTIGDSAFAGCSSLTSIEIPNSVTSIGNRAFEGCNIEEAIVPAFACEFIKNPNLKKVIVTSGDELKNNAFEGCSSLTSIEIPNSVTSIGGTTFSSCNIEEAIVPAFACGFFRNPSLKKVIVTSGDELKNNAFEGCSSLTSIEIPNSVTSIGIFAFAGCSSLTSIEIPNSVTSIGISAFEGCSSLTSIEIPNSVTSIDSHAFKGCSSLTSIEIPNSVTSIGISAFEGCSSLMSIEIPNSVTSIDSHAFKGCTSLISIEIPNSVTSIGISAFKGCTSLISIEIPNSVTSIDIRAFEDCLIEEAIVSAFACRFINNASLKKVIVTSGDKLEDRAFEGCSLLTSIEIPNSVTSIGKRVFYSCSSLTSIEIPNSVISIESQAFMGCSSLMSIEIPKDVTNIQSFAFCDCSSLTSIEIPNSVTRIEDYAFARCSSLISIEIPKSVTSIVGHAFKGCSSLTSIEIPNSVTSISGTFEDCTSLTNIEIPNSVTSIGAHTFAGCSSLTSIHIPDSVGSIAEFAFSGCSALKSIAIPNRVCRLTICVFSGCSSLISIEIPKSVSIEEYAFKDCSSLKKIYYRDSQSEWDSLNIKCNIPDATVYFYSEAKPTNDGNYWHYVEGVVVEWE